MRPTTTAPITPSAMSAACSHGRPAKCQVDRPTMTAMLLTFGLYPWFIRRLQRKQPFDLIRFPDGYGEGFASQLTRSDFDDSEGAIRIVEETEQCQIDIFTRMSSRRYADAVADASTLMLRGLPIRYASKASLIGWKESSVREKDKLDAIALRKLQADPHAFD